MTQIKPEIFQEVLSAYDLGEGTITHNAYGKVTSTIQTW